MRKRFVKGRLYFVSRAADPSEGVLPTQGKAPLRGLQPGPGAFNSCFWVVL
jgi:hypothetical protein